MPTSLIYKAFQHYAVHPKSGVTQTTHGGVTQTAYGGVSQTDFWVVSEVCVRGAVEGCNDERLWM